MADQTIAIRLILRDELSKSLAPITAEMQRLSRMRIDTAHHGMERFGGVVRVVHRELSTLSRITLGGLVGGGVIAGIASAVKGMQEMARQNIQLRYTAESLGVSTKFMQGWTDALSGLGQSPQAAASQIKRALDTISESVVKGRESPLGKFLLENLGGPQIWAKFKNIVSKQGREAGLEFLASIGGQIKNKDAQRKFFEVIGFDTIAAKDIQKILSQLPERLELSQEQVDALALANAKFERSWANITTVLTSEVLPGVTQVTQALSDYLQTEGGKKFAADLGKVANDIAESMAAWIREGGLQSTLDALKTAFEAADAVIKGIGFTWPQAIGLLVGIKFGAWLIEVAAGLAGLSKYIRLIRLLPWVAAYFGARWFRDAVDAEKREREALEKQPGRLTDQPGLTEEQKKNLDELQRQRKMIVPQTQGPPEWFKWLFKQSGEGAPKTDQERRADMQEEKNQRELLTTELADLGEELRQVNSYLQIGGPEGTAGSSGYGAGVGGGGDPLGGDLNRAVYDTMFKQGPMAGKYDTIVAAAAKQDLSPSLLAGIIALESKASGGPFGMSRATLNFLNPGGLMGGGRGNTKFQIFPNIERGIDQTAAVVARNLQKGGGTFEGLANIYSPAVDPKTGRPYPNDPHGTNRLWPNLVSKFTSQLTDRGFDPGGLQDAVPSTISPIARALADENTARVSGSATIDIDVGGLNQPARNPEDLFRPQPLEGAVQMQNASQSQHNPLSFQ